MGISVELKSRLREAPPRLRLLLVVCLVLSVLASLHYASSRWRDVKASLEQSLEMKMLEHERFSRNLADAETFEKMYAELHSVREELITSRMVKALTPPLSEAMFQHIVNEWAEESGVSILSMRTLPRLEQEGFSRMRMAVTTRAEIGAIQEFMELVRQSPRFVFFEEVEIRQISAQERRYYYFNAQLVSWTMP
ncbi:GspMb/PilO family protein [Desulfonatronum thioautotrophicum]|uniref:GspMb/PilO family protein n=1 Tax=Desulfonatronum thioautotrophicum TaxID=617001 RepID=UPI0005EB7A73|nr:GspMb/PilO family protein [Desulfonatronum thioautotrophicum]